MELKSVLLARSIWLFDSDEINPHGKDIKQVLRAIGERYHFTKYPKEDKDFIGIGNSPKDGAEFVGGTFRDLVVGLTVFDDGIVAETRSSTDDTDTFVEDLLQWLVIQFGFVYERGTVGSKSYVSQLLVTTDRSVAALNPKLAGFAEKLASLTSTENNSVVYEPGGIIFRSDPANKISPSFFTFDRRAGVPFRENKYFSQAPLRTQVHLDMLSELENILS